MKKTPLYEKHCRAGGKIIDFGGWALPVEYKGILDEHECVRSAAGLFDVSHMGEITVAGEAAERFLQMLLTNDISRAAAGRVVYSPMCYPTGGTVDDLLVYKRGEGDYLLVVNAANTDKDYEWMLSHATEGVRLENVSERYAQLALQGPLAERILQRLTDTPLESIRFYHFAEDVAVCGEKVLLSRTGYTGEDGFELYLRADRSPFLWDALLEAGKPDGLQPVGLGARDTLRFEAALPLYGHELSADISPLQAGLLKFVKLEKEDFIGRQALVDQFNEGIRRRIAGFELEQRGIARGGYQVIAGGGQAGVVTTGSYSPTLKKSVGLALMDADFAHAGAAISVIIRGKPVNARVIPLPFYNKRYRNH